MLKNKVEIKDDIALIHVSRNGFDNIVIIDAEDLPMLERRYENRLNLDTAGYVQHRRKRNGEYEVEQLHRALMVAFDWETVSHKNGNKLDCRKSNLETNLDINKLLA